MAILVAISSAGGAMGSAQDGSDRGTAASDGRLWWRPIRFAGEALLASAATEQYRGLDEEH
jgi:hypothetical protein